MGSTLTRQNRHRHRQFRAAQIKRIVKRSLYHYHTRKQHDIFIIFTPQNAKSWRLQHATSPNLSMLALLDCWRDCAAGFSASPGIYKQDKRPVLLSSGVRFHSCSFQKCSFGEMNANVAQGNRRLTAEDPKTKKENKFCGLENNASGRTCPLDWKKTEPILICAQRGWGGGCNGCFVASDWLKEQGIKASHVLSIHYLNWKKKNT